MKWILIIAAAALLALFVVALPTPGAIEAPVMPDGSFVISNVRLFDGERTTENATVVVRNGLIESAGAAIEAPAGLPVVDGAGKTLLPGLIDAHTHVWQAALRESVVFGVTTELDMFTSPEVVAAGRRKRDDLASRDETDLFSAGTLVTAPGGHGTEYGMHIPTLEHAADARAFVEARIAEGSDYIKIVLEDGSAFGMKTPALDRERLCATVTAAHALERLALVHATTLGGAREAAACGADGLVHVFGDAEADGELVALVKERGMFVIPTLTVLESLDPASGEPAVAADAKLEPYLTVAQRTNLRATFPFRKTSRTKLDNAIANVRALHAAGVSILSGTDAPNPGTAHGASLHRELELLVRAGLAPVEALAAATSVPGKRFGLTGRGRVAKGNRADLVLVDGDPTRDILATRAIVAVWKNGHPVTRAMRKTVAEARAKIATEPVLADFEESPTASKAGSAWSVSTDAMMGGTSVGAISAAPGAPGSPRGALRLEGELRPGFAFPWSAAMWFPADPPMTPVDASPKRELVFWIRGSSGARVMIFAESLGGRPAEVVVTLDDNWREVRLPFDRFRGLDASGLQALAFSGGPQRGAFWLEVDRVELR
jgi:imidazolonepropionase-like amidohydrolase